MYKIGSVARLTGLTTHALRKWEDRYQIVAPQRTTAGDRLYSQDDLTRLALSKALVDHGMALKRVATLDQHALTEAYAAHFGASPLGRLAKPRGDHLRIAILGGALPASLNHRANRLPGVRIAASAADAQDLKQQIADTEIDALLVEVAVVDADTLNFVQRLRSQLSVRLAAVIYAFGNRSRVNALKEQGLTLRRAPMTAEAFRSLIGEFKTVADSSSFVAPPRRISDEVLGRIMATEPQLECLCPTQTSELVLKLAAFEQFSLDCAVETEGVDRDIHHMLYRISAKARSEFEAALVILARHEGISLD